MSVGSGSDRTLTLKDKVLHAYYSSVWSYDAAAFEKWRKGNGVDICTSCEGSPQAAQRTCPSVVAFRKAMILREFGISSETYDTWLQESKDIEGLIMRSGVSGWSDNITTTGTAVTAGEPLRIPPEDREPLAGQSLNVPGTTENPSLRATQLPPSGSSSRPTSTTPTVVPSSSFSFSMPFQNPFSGPPTSSRPPVLVPAFPQRSSRTPGIQPTPPPQHDATYVRSGEAQTPIRSHTGARTNEPLSAVETISRKQHTIMAVNPPARVIQDTTPVSAGFQGLDSRGTAAPLVRPSSSVSQPVSLPLSSVTMPVPPQPTPVRPPAPLLPPSAPINPPRYAPFNQFHGPPSYSYNDLLTRYQELLATSSAVENQNIWLHTNSHTLRKENSELRQGINALAESKSMLRLEVSEIRMENEAAVRAKEETEKKLAEREVELGAKIDEVEKLREADEAKSQEKIEGLEKRVKDLEVEKAALAMAYGTFTKEAEDIKAGLAKKASDSEENARAQEDVNRVLILSNAWLVKEREQMTSHSESMKAELTRMMRQLEEMKSVIAVRENREASDDHPCVTCQRSSEVVQELETRHSGLCKRNDDLVKERDDATLRAAEVEMKYRELHSQSEGVKAFIVKLLERDSSVGLEKAMDVLPFRQEEHQNGDASPSVPEAVMGEQDPSGVVHTASSHLSSSPDGQLAGPQPIDLVSAFSVREAAIMQEKEALKAEKDALRVDKATLRQKYAAFNQRSDDFSKRLAAHRAVADAGPIPDVQLPSPPHAEREAALNEERVTLELEREELRKEGAVLKQRGTDYNRRSDELKMRANLAPGIVKMHSRAPSASSPTATPTPGPELAAVASSIQAETVVSHGEGIPQNKSEDRKGGFDLPTEEPIEPAGEPYVCPTEQNGQGPVEISQMLITTSSSTLASSSTAVLAPDIVTPTQKSVRPIDPLAANNPGPDNIGSMLLSQIGSWSTMSSLVQQCLTIASVLLSTPLTRSPLSTSHLPPSRMDDDQTPHHSPTLKATLIASTTSISSLRTLRNHLEVMRHICLGREKALVAAASSITCTFQENLEVDCCYDDLRVGNMKKEMGNGKDMDGIAGTTNFAVEAWNFKRPRPSSPSLSAYPKPLSYGSEGERERERIKMRRREKQLLLLDLEEVECRKAELRLRRLKLLQEDDGIEAEGEVDMEHSSVEESADEGVEFRRMGNRPRGQKSQTTEDVSLRPSRRRRGCSDGGFDERPFDAQLSSRRKRLRARELQDAELPSEEDSNYDSELALPACKRHSSATSKINQSIR
ncbi:hypothetical protein ONZ45_g9814 [Pleurotus djamor]|nr:hypothetical protein ONZ45_g9814 [Pleurotus djamor]